MNNVIWEKLSSEIHPSYLYKYQSLDGTELTGIRPIHGRERMTNLFGPAGLGWGYKISDPIKVGAGVTVKVSLWYKPSEITEGVEQETVSSVEEYGTIHPVANPESLKMAVSSALNRCFMALGHGATIYGALSSEGDAPSKVDEETQVQEPLPEQTVLTEEVGETSSGVSTEISESESSEVASSSKTDEQQVIPSFPISTEDVDLEIERITKMANNVLVELESSCSQQQEGENLPTPQQLPLSTPAPQQQLLLSAPDAQETTSTNLFKEFFEVYPELGSIRPTFYWRSKTKPRKTTGYKQQPGNSDWFKEVGIEDMPPQKPLEGFVLLQTADDCLAIQFNETSRYKFKFNAGKSTFRLVLGVDQIRELIADRAIEVVQEAA